PVTVAGTNNTWSYSGDGGPGPSATLNSPCGLALDGAGNLYVADSTNNRIRKLAANGTITTVAGTGNNSSYGDGTLAVTAGIYNPTAVAVDSANNLYIADTYGSLIRKVTAATGTITTVAATVSYGYSVDGGAATSAI